MTADAFVVSDLTEEQRELLPFRGRGLSEMTKRLGDVVGLIGHEIRHRGKVSVLEIGCGFGLVLGELKKIFGDSIEIVGLNKIPRHGCHGTMKRTLVERRVYREDEIDTLALPKIWYHDVNDGFPFPDGSFDFLVSQVTLLHVEEKAKFIEETHRVLKIGGRARIDLCLSRTKLPWEYGTSFEIEENGETIAFWEYASRFTCLKRGRAAGKREYLEIQKIGASLRLGLELMSAQNLNDVDPDWHGRRSVFASVAHSSVGVERRPGGV